MTGVQPDALKERPELDAVDSWYFDEYVWLESDRPPAYMSIPNIPFGAIREHGKEFGTIEDDLRTFCEIIAKIDNKYLEWVNRPKATKAKKGAAR